MYGICRFAMEFERKLSSGARCAVTTALEMGLPGAKKNLHTMIAEAKTENIMQCAFTKTNFEVAFTEMSKVRRLSDIKGGTADGNFAVFGPMGKMPQKGNLYVLTGYLSEDAKKLLVERWGECSPAEFDARSCQRVQYQLWLKKQEEREIANLWVEDNEDDLDVIYESTMKTATEESGKGTSAMAADDGKEVKSSGEGGTGVMGKIYSLLTGKGDV